MALSKELNETMEYFKEKGLIFCPNSIYHGTKFRSSKIGDQLINANMEINRLVDFLEFLFDHSEHCDHISQGEAWDEFMMWEEKTFNQH